MILYMMKLKVIYLIILDGKELKNKRLNLLKEEVSKLDRKLSLVVIQVGEDPASCVYVEQKKKMALSVGYNFIHEKLESNVSEEELLNIIDKYNDDDSIDGILVQMPLPNHINEAIVQNKIVYYKDVDGLSDINAGRLVHNSNSLISCTPKGILSLLEEYNIELKSKHVVIVGRSNLVGKPLINLLLNKDATVTITHSKTPDLSNFTKNADILIVAVGKKHLITKEMVKEKAIVIDVGINRIDNKLYGDVNYEDVLDKVSYITPVPGGVGPMTVVELGQNLLEAYKIRNDIR